jgi:uncharacterized protein YutE (UPF0331/DUF86 family)
MNVSFEAYLQSTTKIAECEKELLDLLSDRLRATAQLNKIELRAARASLQILIENSIGKARRILKHYDCPLVPSRGRDAFMILYDCGALDDEHYRSLMQAVGFRSAMIHDYMNFDEDVLVRIVSQQRYLAIYEFLIQRPDYNSVQSSRIKGFVV